MQTRAKFGAIPRTAIILVTLGILALVLTAVAIGAQPSQRLAPLFGPAGNGKVFSERGRRHLRHRPRSSTWQPFATDPQLELYQTMTNDGSQLLYQLNDGNTSVLTIAAADGTGEPRQIGGEFATLEDWWPSPDGTLVGINPPENPADRSPHRADQRR